MNFLFVHQNFPGQFRHVAAALADAGHGVVAVGDAANLKGRPLLHPRIRLLAYTFERGGSAQTHHYIRDFEGAVRRGQAVARLALGLKEKGFMPEVVVAHPAWGEALFLRDLFPTARQVYYFEYFYRAEGGDVGFDPEFPLTFDGQFKLRVKNSTQLLSLEAADDGLAPTEWQRSRYPAEFRDKIRVIHEGVDTNLVRPDPQAQFEADGVRLAAGDEVVTYVSRNLEPYRGFHVFMRALPRILEARPQARVLIVGGDDVSYGRRLPEGETYRELYCKELGERVDWSRVHFLGRLPYAGYLKVLQVSAVHVYLTYPFVLSWSMLEAMAAGCVVVASATPPVEEVIRDGENGLLVDFFDLDGLADRVIEVLANPARYGTMRARAREAVVQRYDLKTHCLPEMLEYLTGRPPSGQRR